MKIRSLVLPLAVTLSAMLAAQPGRADHNKNFHCDFNSFVHPDAIAGLRAIAGTNQNLQKIAEYYTLAWEDAEIERACMSASKGNKEDFSCLGGRQDFEAIRVSIPEALFSMNVSDVREHTVALQKARAKQRPRDQALQMCGDLGVIDRSFK